MGMKGMGSRGLLLMDGDGKGRKGKSGKGKERRRGGDKKEERGWACLTNEKSFPSPAHRHCSMPHGSNISSSSS